MASPNRKGWPQYAVERAECANCGKYGYSTQYATPRGDIIAYTSWLTKEPFPLGNAQQTKLGFFVWCSELCESTWKTSRLSDVNKSDGWAHGHRIEMDKRAITSGIL
tara:strand:- start:647 stop:967 length:321 start_codon:yes stop_codon:yes gene_type:complete